MLSTRGQRLEELFGQALAHPLADREGFLLQACGDDGALAQELRSLLLAHDQAGSFLEPPPLTLAADDQDLDLSAAERSIGAYELVREIGRGGMSTVWLAERADDAYERRVAVKLIKRGMDSADVLRRFRAERQILAGLDHPNIARLYDGGETALGRPYFVLEYVAGRPIDEECERRGLSLAERLELFRTVAAAVEHAHRNLVIHRDLKPGNILVTADGVPKLLDFGIARLLASEEVEATATQARLLTPQYASPEQFRGERLTTATDVYSLGVLLYKLLTGRLPYRLEGRSPLVLEQLLDAGIPRPSSVPEGPFGRALAGDLDNIVLKAMHPEPDRRYGSVALLAEDLRRYLAGLPVAAREDSPGYRLGKFLRRHRLPVAAASLAALLVVAFAVAAVVQSIAAARERDAAQRERDQAEQVTQVLTGLFAAADPFAAEGAEPTVRQLLDRESDRIVRELAPQPRLQARLMDVLGSVYTSLRLHDRARPLLEGALAIRRRESGPESLEVAESLASQGRLEVARGDAAQAEASYRKALTLEQRWLDEGDPRIADTMAELGDLLSFKGDLAAAEELQRRVLALRRRLPAPHLDLASSLNDLAVTRFRQGELGEAEQLIRDAVAKRRRLLGADHPLTADSIETLALCLVARGDAAAAVPLLREVLAARRQRLGPEHPRVGTALANLAAALLDMGDLAAAEPLLREALTLRRRALGNDHPVVANSLYSLGFLLRERGEFKQAEPLLRESLAIERHFFAPGAWEIGITTSELGNAICRQGDVTRGEPLLREGLAIQRQALPAGHERLVGALGSLGHCLVEAGRFPEAESLLLEANALLSGTSESALRRRRERSTLAELAHLYDRWGRKASPTGTSPPGSASRR